MTGLTCHGCAHEASIECREKNVHQPSGERPCCFCTSNPDRKYEVQTWYDGSKPVKVPMDCYHSLDMAEQIRQWEGK